MSTDLLTLVVGQVRDESVEAPSCPVIHLSKKKKMKESISHSKKRGEGRGKEDVVFTLGPR